MNWMGVIISALNGEDVDFEELAAACEYLVETGLVYSLGSEVAGLVASVFNGVED